MTADKMRTQRSEFEALIDLEEAFKRLPAIVDDDYPERRHNYEGLLRDFIKAVVANRGMQFIERECQP